AHRPRGGRPHDAGRVPATGLADRAADAGDLLGRASLEALDVGVPLWHRLGLAVGDVRVLEALQGTPDPPDAREPRLRSGLGAPDPLPVALRGAVAPARDVPAR